MKLSDEDILTLSNQSIKAALIAGKIIQSYKSKDLSIQYKSSESSFASSIVTEVDLLCQSAILDYLAPTLERYNLGLLAEESKDNNSRFERDYFWCIDPIDGTLPFTEKIAGYSVSIALVASNGNVILGTIYDPHADKLYTAIKDKGTEINGDPFKIAPINNKTLTAFIHRSLKTSKTFVNVEMLIKDLATEMNLENIVIKYQGGAAMNGCWLLEESPSIYFAIPKNEPGGGSIWDYAASSLIVNEAGGFARDFQGKELKLNRRDSTYMGKYGILYSSTFEIAERFIRLRD